MNAANADGQQDDPYDLARFLSAQERDYNRALSELQHGEKRTHWMWYIFPQIAGLAISSTARLYALKSVAEARAYLAHPVLGTRLRECAGAILRIDGKSANQILGMPDDLKLKSCATLFAAISIVGSVFEEVLAILGVAALLAHAISDRLIFRDSQKLAAMPPTVQVALMILSCSLVACKYRQLVHTVRCMAPERASYEAAWQQILAREGALVELRRLEELTLQAAGPPFLQRRFC